MHILEISSTIESWNITTAAVAVNSAIWYARVKYQKVRERDFHVALTRQWISWIRMYHHWKSNGRVYWLYSRVYTREMRNQAGIKILQQPVDIDDNGGRTLAFRRESCEINLSPPYHFAGKSGGGGGDKSLLPPRWIISHDTSKHPGNCFHGESKVYIWDFQPVKIDGTRRAMQTNATRNSTAMNKNIH